MRASVSVCSDPLILKSPKLQGRELKSRETLDALNPRSRPWTVNPKPLKKPLKQPLNPKPYINPLETALLLQAGGDEVGLTLQQAWQSWGF